MKVTTDMLFGEKPEVWRITCPASESNAFSKMLKAASRLCKHDPAEDVTVASLHLSGLTYDEDEDAFVLILFLGLL